jgi:NTP pyrophosphatase (non-canonical NTP hydrolase)
MEKIMTTLKFGGQSFETSASRDAYAALRRKYYDIGVKENELFKAQFLASFSTADELFEQFPAVVEGVIHRSTETALADIATHQIYDVDEAAFGSLFAARRSAWEGAYDKFRDDYLAITLSSAELETQRAERAANRGGVIGGGFGLEGAARGVAVAAVANAALGIVHGLANQTGRALTAMGDKRKKAALLRDPSTQEGLGDVLFEIAFATHLLIAELVNDRSGRVAYDFVAKEDAIKATAFRQNIVKGRVPEDTQAEVLGQALALNPFDIELWREWINRFGDADDSVATAAACMHMNEVKEYKDQLIMKKFAFLPAATPELCLASAEEIKGYGAHLGVDTNYEVDRLNTKADELDRLRRTFNGTAYETMEEMAEAQAAYRKAKEVTDEIAKRTVDGFVYDTPELANHARNSLAERTWRNKVYADMADIELEKNKSRMKIRAIVVTIAPFPNALFSFSKGYTWKFRARSILWMVAYLIIFNRSPDHSITDAIYNIHDRKLITDMIYMSIFVNGFFGFIAFLVRLGLEKALGLKKTI